MINKYDSYNYNPLQLKNSKKISLITIFQKNSGGLSSKRVGKTVQQYAKDVLAGPNATSLQKRTNFARNGRCWFKK